MVSKCSITLFVFKFKHFLRQACRKSLSWNQDGGCHQNWAGASFNTSLDLRSRWLVGSSRMSRLTGSSSNLTMAGLGVLTEKHTYFYPISSPENINNPGWSSAGYAPRLLLPSSTVWKTVSSGSNRFILRKITDFDIVPDGTPRSNRDHRWWLWSWWI